MQRVLRREQYLATFVTPPPPIPQHPTTEFRDKICNLSPIHSTMGYGIIPLRGCQYCTYRTSTIVQYTSDPNIIGPPSAKPCFGSKLQPPNVSTARAQISCLPPMLCISSRDNVTTQCTTDALPTGMKTHATVFKIVLRMHLRLCEAARSGSRALYLTHQQTSL